MTATHDASPPCVAVFTRDLRLHENPMLSAAVDSGRPVVPVFVHDQAIIRGLPRRAERDAYLGDALADLDRSLRARGAALVQRRGDWSTEVLRVATAFGADTVHVLEDVTPYARRRLELLRRGGGRVAVHGHEGVTVVPAGAVRPASNDHYSVFTPYHHRWLATPWRSIRSGPRHVPAPTGLGSAADARSASGPARAGGPSGDGGESGARTRLRRWLADGLEQYVERRERLDEAGGSSRLSVDLHFGCLSALEVAARARSQVGGAPFVRQLCWRDFYMQVVTSRPEALWENFARRPWTARSTSGQLDAWREGRTGYPLVDAGMRQLSVEGFLPNRARMVVASFLTKHLGLDWRLGARHFMELLVDADVVVNNFNWQWTGGTGTGSHPERALSPVRQGKRFDPSGSYVRRFVPELEGLPAARVHDPTSEDRRRAGYPAPLLAR